MWLTRGAFQKRWVPTICLWGSIKRKKNKPVFFRKICKVCQKFCHARLSSSSFFLVNMKVVAETIPSKAEIQLIFTSLFVILTVSPMLNSSRSYVIRHVSPLHISPRWKLRWSYHIVSKDHHDEGRSWIRESGGWPAPSFFSSSWIVINGKTPPPGKNSAMNLDLPKITKGSVSITIYLHLFGEKFGVMEIKCDVIMSTWTLRVTCLHGHQAKEYPLQNGGFLILINGGKVS